MALAVDTQDGNPQSVLNHVRDFLKWRRETPAMRLGDIEFIDASDPLIAFRRSYQGQTYTCVYNASVEHAQVKMQNIGAVQKLLDISRHAERRNETLMFEPYGYAILSH